MELTVLGAHGTWPLKDGATSGYLVRHDGFKLWIDMGTGTLAKLQRHIDPFEVDAVVISHAHPDHLVDLYPYFYARYFHPERPTGLPLYAPPGVFERAGGLLSDQARTDLQEIFELYVTEPGEGFEAGPFRVETAPMRHPVPTLGLRVEDGAGSTLAYSADTGPTDALVRLARDADVLLCEATWERAVEGWPPLHLSASEAGEHAARAGTGRLVLTHIWPTNDRVKAVERASEAFGQRATLAEEGLTVKV